MTTNLLLWNRLQWALSPRKSRWELGRKKGFIFGIRIPVGSERTRFHVEISLITFLLWRSSRFEAAIFHEDELCSWANLGWNFIRLMSEFGANKSSSFFQTTKVGWCALLSRKGPNEILSRYLALTFLTDEHLVRLWSEDEKRSRIAFWSCFFRATYFFAWNANVND